MRHSALDSNPPHARTTASGGQPEPLATPAHRHPAHGAVLLDEVRRPGAVEDRDVVRARRLGQGLDEPRPAAPDLHREPAPELVAPVHPERLAPVRGAEPHPVAAHPAKRLEAAVDEGLGEVRIGAPLGEAPEVVEVLLARVGAEVDVAPLVLGEVRHELHEVVNPAEHEPHGARRVAAVPARFVLRRPLEHGHPRPAFARREGRAERRVARAHYNDVLFHDADP